MLRHRLTASRRDAVHRRPDGDAGTHAAEAVPARSLVRATLRAALLVRGWPRWSAASRPQVTILAEGVLRTMFVTKIKMAALMLFVAGLLATGGVLTQDALKAAPQPETRAKDRAQNQTPPRSPMRSRYPCAWSSRRRADSNES